MPPISRLHDGLRIRDCAQEDAAGIDTLIAAAFAASAYGFHGEAALVRALHQDGDVLVSLVAEMDGVFVGHALFSRMTIVSDGRRIKGASLAPVSVDPRHQATGIGTALIRDGLDRLTDAGIPVCFVLGDPAYYTRFGFSTQAALPFGSPYAGPHFLAVWLDKSFPLPESGRADHAPAFARSE